MKYRIVKRDFFEFVLPAAVMIIAAVGLLLLGIIGVGVSVRYSESPFSPLYFIIGLVMMTSSAVVMSHGAARLEDYRRERVWRRILGRLS